MSIPIPGQRGVRLCVGVASNSRMRALLWLAAAGWRYGTMSTVPASNARGWMEPFFSDVMCSPRFSLVNALSVAGPCAVLGPCLVRVKKFLRIFFLLL